MSRIQFTLCGSYGADEALNPYAVTEADIRQEILSLINLKPLASEELSEMLRLAKEEVAGHLAALERAGLLERIGPKYKPSFAIFTTQDQERLQSLVDELSQAFARVIEENISLVHETYAACGFAKHGFSFADIAYILVGAYLFDYGGLEALSKAGFLMISKEMPGGHYVFTGFEGGILDLRSRWQWGHSYPFGHFTFFSHGELPAEGRRQAFPEQAYQWWKEGWTEEEVTRTMEELGKILVALYEAPMGLEKLVERTGLKPGKLAEHLLLLRKLEYVDEEGEEKDVWSSCCPVVDSGAKARIQGMVQEIWAKLLDLALRPNWKELSRFYQETAPARNGIEIREAFNPIYHAIFEQSLRLLMEQGAIPWPKRHADGARYAIWVQRNAERLK